MRPALAVSLVLLASCFPRATVPEAERQRAERELEGARRWLKVALNVGQFYGDASRLLGSDQPFVELELLESPGGKVITPPEPQRVLPPGTPVRVTRVEFPTGWIIARRVAMTPRYHPWVYLQVADEERPVVLVLPQQLETFEDVRLEVDRWLSDSDPAPVLAGFSADHRAAIARKRLADDMPARAVEMSWGYPEKKLVDRPAGTEEWSWPGERRRAWFRDGRLVRWSPL